jgi:DnaJ-class molecular chaperone
VDVARVAAGLLCPVIATLTICYFAVCAARPFRTCRRCAGTGLRGIRRGLRSRACRRCGGAGIRIRYGRHLLNEITRLYCDGNR